MSELVLKSFSLLVMHVASMRAQAALEPRSCAANSSCSSPMEPPAPADKLASKKLLTDKL